MEQERNGDLVDQDLVQKVLESFISLGLDESDISKVSFNVYQEHFEKPFLAATKRYYKQKSRSILAGSNGVSKYLEMVEGRLRKEEDHAEMYLTMQTRTPLVSTCEDILIREQAEFLWGSFQNILDCDSDEDMQRIYSLLSRIPEGLEPLLETFQEHVKKAGLAAVSKLVDNGGANAGVHATVYVYALLEVYTKYMEMVTKNFRGDAGFTAGLDSACQEFVNRNAATGPFSAKTAELVVEHIDILLRNGHEVAKETDVDGALNWVVRIDWHLLLACRLTCDLQMMLFKYIEDKDAFRTFYASKLSERLLHAMSSNRSEAIMISKLEEAGSSEYTKELQDMFKGTYLCAILDHPSC
jgi:cullin 1